MTTIAELAQQEGMAPGMAPGVASSQEGVAPPPRAEVTGQPSVSLIDILKTPTGPGRIEDYMEKALNFDGSRGLARVLRGLSGFVSELSADFAVVDILAGLWEWAKGRGSNAGAANQSA